MEYTVEAVADLLATNTETVRRWIRDGKLKSTCLSNRQGHRIQEEDLKTFLQSSKKYSKALALLAIPAVAAINAPVTLVSATVGAVAGVMNFALKKDATTAPQPKQIDPITALQTQITQSQQIIAEIEEEIQRLQQQIQLYIGQQEVYQKQIEVYNSQLDLWQNQLPQHK